MDKNTVLIATIALLLGFIGGFMLANSLNRSEITARMTAAAPRANTSAGAPDDLSPQEIREKIDEADRNPDNLAFQKNLGIGLYRYGAMKQDDSIIAEAARILTRANGIAPQDVDVLVTLGNAHFDLGYARRETDGFEKARDLYIKALAIRPTDLDVRTDLGISYFVQPQPDLVKAAAELEKVASTDQRHDRSRQFLAQVYIKQARLDEAAKMIAKIKEISPSNPAITELTSQLDAARSGK